MRFFKFLALSALLMSAFSISALAQVSGYIFAESAGTYTVLGGTNSTATGDDGTQATIPIGFTFNLGGTTYTEFAISTNGFIKLGNGATTITGSHWVNSLSNTAVQRPFIAALWDDNHRNTGAITYSTTGAPGSQVLTVDWNAVSIGGGGSTGGNASFQIKIYETTNVVEVIYGGTLAIDPGGLSASVGLNDSASFSSVTPGSPGTASGVSANNAIAATTNMVGKMYRFTPPPASVFFSTTSYGVAENGVNAVVTVNRAGSTAAIASVDVVTSNGSATTPGDYTGGTYPASFGIGIATTTVNIPITDDGVFEFSESFNVALQNPVGVPLGTPIAAVVNIADNEQIPAGAYTVGAGGNYGSLTNAGGIFDAINTAGVGGPITVNITSNLTSETGATALNEIVGSPAVTIRPSGGVRRISGIAPIAVIRLNGADNITINGSTTAPLVGGNEPLRELVVINESTSGRSVIAVSSGATGAQGNTIKNVQVIGNAPNTTVIGIALGGATPGTAGTDNDNNRVENCYVSKAIYGIFSAGLSLANQNTGTVITQNNLGATGAGRIFRVGIFVVNEGGIQITENLVGGIDNTGEGADAIGIGVGTQTILSTGTASGGVTDAVVSRNKINGVRQDSTFSAAGIAVAGAVGGANTISNNMISGVIANSNLGDIVAGIWIAGVAGSATRVYNNSVSMTGDRSALSMPAATGQFPGYGIAITGTDPTVELKNNIFSNSQTAVVADNPGALSYGIGMQTTTFVNLDSDFNLFLSTGANDGGFRTATLTITAPVNFADVTAWSGAVADDVNSITIGEVDPQFTAPASNLHISAASPARNVGTTLVSVTVDFDGQARPNGADPLAGDVPEAVAYDVGGDEFYAPTAANVSLRGRVKTAAGNPLRNVKLTISGGNLTEPRIVTTGSLGIYEFEDLVVGETYIVTVQSKRFTITEPVRVISLNGAIEDFDFTALEP